MMKKNKILMLCFVLAAVLSLSGVPDVFAHTQKPLPDSSGNAVLVAETTDGAVETPPPEDEPDPPSILIKKYPASMEVGETDKLSYTLTKSDDDEVSWESSDSQILSIDSDGNITANGPGTVTVTVRARGTKDSVDITVREVQAESIKIVSEDFSLTDGVTGNKMKKGDVVLLKVEADPKEAAVDEIAWDVDDNEVAEIDGDGTLRALKNGKVTVTAAVGDLTAEIEIQVGGGIPWVLIGVCAFVIILIIVLLSLIIRKKAKSRYKPKRNPGSKHDRYDEYDDGDYDDEYDDYDDRKKKREELEKERIRREAYRRGFEDRDKEMTKVFDPKDFEFKDDK